MLIGKINTKTFHKVMRDNGLIQFIKPKQTREFISQSNKSGVQMIQYNEAIKRMA